MSTETVLKAPPGFTVAQREEFDRQGYVTIENVLSDEEIERYLEAIERHMSAESECDRSKTYVRGNIVEDDPVFTELIDHPRHVGFAYDLYGEQLKLQQSHFFVRPRGGDYNLWHPDGPRALPYGTFAPDHPLQLRVGYWLTDLPEPKMGNLVLMPGSHRSQYFDHYDTDASVPGEDVLCVRRGAMTVVGCNVWHRVEPNESETVRKNFFITYCPSWVCTGDRLLSDPDWLQTIGREQRIIMRSYADGYTWAKPPAEDFPLYLDRDTGQDSDPGLYHERVLLHRRKRRVAHEK
jgi:hypothetical protein